MCFRREAKIQRAVFHGTVPREPTGLNRKEMVVNFANIGRSRMEGRFSWEQIRTAIKRLGSMDIRRSGCGV